MPKQIKIERSEEKPVPKKFLDKEIVSLARSCRELLTSGLKEDDLVDLIFRRARGITSRSDVRSIVEAIKQLGKDYAIKP